MTNELTLIEINQDNEIQMIEQFTSGIDPILDKIEKEVNSIVLDPSTEQGRKEIKSLARKVSSSKAQLEDFRRKITSDWLNKKRIVDAEGQKVRERLDNLRDKVRKPVTDFENKEKTRIETHEIAIKNMIDCNDSMEEDITSEDIKGSIVLLKKTFNRNWEEFESRARQSYEQTYAILENKLEKILKEEAEKIELEKLRAEKEKQERIEREKVIAKNARMQAEEKARIERLEAERKSQKLIEEEKQKLIDAENRAKALEEQRLKDIQEAEERKKEEMQKAIEDERLRIESIAKKEAEEKAKREADKRHKSKIHIETLNSLKSLEPSFSDEILKGLIVAIANNKIKNLQINY